MVEIVALTGGERRFQKVAAAIIHPSRDRLALETPASPVRFCIFKGKET